MKESGEIFQFLPLDKFIKVRYIKVMMIKLMEITL
jgi:hypothetical protein